MARLPSRLQKGTKCEWLRRRGWETQMWCGWLGGNPVHSCSSAGPALGPDTFTTVVGSLHPPLLVASSPADIMRDSG